jgi:hypothetical protein
MCVCAERDSERERDSGIERYRGRYKYIYVCIHIYSVCVYGCVLFHL